MPAAAPALQPATPRRRALQSLAGSCRTWGALPDAAVDHSRWNRRGAGGLTHQELAGEWAADAEPADRRGLRHRAVHFRGATRLIMTEDSYCLIRRVAGLADMECLSARTSALVLAVSFLL